MRFGSLFSGIGGIDLGLERAGMECAWQVEIDPYRREVLARHWPDVRRYEDVRDCCRVDGALQEGNRQRCDRCLDPVDLICGGFPCQDVSTAGKRAGLRAERSGLFFEFARIVGELRPKWFLVENVPGLYSSNAGKDFDIVIGTLAELGYGLAWRVLDSQHFGVPQRRRRVFIVGYLGGPCPPAVLFEREGGEGDSAEGRKAGQSIAHSLRASPRGVDEHTGTTYIPETGYALPASSRGSGDQHGNWWNSTYIGAPPNPDRVRETTGLPRRLDSRRYAALGDAVTVNVAEWIGKRIMLADAAMREAE